MSERLVHVPYLFRYVRVGSLSYLSIFGVIVYRCVGELRNFRWKLTGREARSA